jgi:hypothetical protein
MTVDQLTPAPFWRAVCWAAASALLILGVLAALAPEVATAGGAEAPAGPSHETTEAVRWGLLIGAGVVLAIALLLKGTVLRVIIGVDERVSTSKTVATVWTFVIAAALLGLVYARLIGHPEAFEATNASGVVGQYALLFGGPLGAAILAKTIVTKQVSENPSGKPPSTEGPSPSDLIVNDAGDTDLGDLQYVLFNTVALVFMIGTLLHDPASGLPHIPDVLLGLTSVSAAGYVGKKLLPPEAMSARLSAEAGRAHDPVTISVSGLPAGLKKGRFWVHFGPDAESVLSGEVDIVGGVAAPEVQVPTLAPPPANPVKLPVTVIPDGGTLITAGSFEYIP